MPLDHPASSTAPLTVTGMSLDQLCVAVASCTKCPLALARNKAVCHSGPYDARLVLLGEAPGAQEDASGTPFCGASGKLLDAALSAAGTSRDRVYVTNAVKCRPPANRPPHSTELAACRPFLTAQLNLLTPRVVCTLGASALRSIGGPTTGITTLRGTALMIGDLLVVPTVHPAYVLRRRRLEWPTFVADLAAAVALAH